MRTTTPHARRPDGRVEEAPGRRSGTAFIYALRDPETDAVRYIGQTLDPFARFKTYLRATAPGRGVDEWCAALRSRGHVPVFEIVAEVTREEAQAAEAAHIEYHSRRGDILNGRSRREERRAPMDWSPGAISKLRTSLGLSQTAMAPLLGYTRPQSIGDLEVGKRQPSGAVCILLSQLAERVPKPETPAGD